MHTFLCKYFYIEQIAQKMSMYVLTSVGMPHLISTWGEVKNEVR